MLELEGFQGAVAGVELSGGCWDIPMILGLRGLRDNSHWGQWYWEDDYVQNEDMLVWLGQKYSFMEIENIGVRSWWGCEGRLAVEERDH